jgi:hypothetical protein
VHIITCQAQQLKGGWLLELRTLRVPPGGNRPVPVVETLMVPSRAQVSWVAGHSLKPVWFGGMPYGNPAQVSTGRVTVECEVVSESETVQHVPGRMIVRLPGAGVGQDRSVAAKIVSEKAAPTPKAMAASRKTA